MESMKAIHITTVFSMLILIIAYIFNSSIIHPSNDLQSNLSQILEAMLEIENRHAVGEVRVAVGYGACNDLFVKASHILYTEKPPEKSAHYGHLNSLEEVKETFALFFSAGSAAERYVSNETLFRDLVKRAEKHPSSHYILGGNAPVMARRFGLEGAKVMLSAMEETYLIKENLENVIVAGGASRESREDVHLILEYDKGEQWGAFRSSRANRFILHKDQSNPKFSSAQKFNERMKTFKPSLFVVGGLQMMDNYPYKSGEREKYLKMIKDQMDGLPRTTPIHFEMASFSDQALLDGLKKFIIPNVDSLGMNEQELPNIHSLLKYGNVSLVSHQGPRVAEVLDLMREIFKLLGRTSKKTSRPLTRLHVHTLAFQVIMVDLRGSWKDTRAAATKAALVAHRHVCRKKKVDVESSNILMDEGFSLSKHPDTGRVMFDTLKPVSCWVEDTHYKICIAPVLVCTKVRQTAGGGDNISAAGLILQV